VKFCDMQYDATTMLSQHHQAIIKPPSGCRAFSPVSTGTKRKKSTKKHHNCRRKRMTVFMANICNNTQSTAWAVWSTLLSTINTVMLLWTYLTNQCSVTVPKYSPIQPLSEQIMPAAEIIHN